MMRRAIWFLTLAALLVGGLVCVQRASAQQNNQRFGARKGGGGAALPTQTGNAGKFLTTDGANPSWGNAPPPPAFSFTSMALGSGASNVNGPEHNITPTDQSGFWLTAGTEFFAVRSGCTLQGVHTYWSASGPVLQTLQIDVWDVATQGRVASFSHQITANPGNEYFTTSGTPLALNAYKFYRVSVTDITSAHYTYASGDASFPGWAGVNTNDPGSGFWNAGNFILTHHGLQLQPSAGQVVYPSGAANLFLIDPIITC